MKTFSHAKNFKFIEGDVCDAKLIDKYVSISDYLYHGAISGIGISTTSPLEELNTNTRSTLLLLEAVRKKGIKRFVYPSSASVYGNPEKLPEQENDPTEPTSPYGVSKLAAEKYCLVYNKIYNVPVVCLRYFNTYGPRQRSDSLYGGVVSIFIKKALSGRPLQIYGDGNQTRDFTYISDTVTATMSAFTTSNIDGEVINIAAGQEYSVNDLAQKIKQASGEKDLPITRVDKRLVDNIERRTANIKKAKKLLHYSPKTSLDKGLRITYQWNKDNLKKSIS
jgi:UDP-glucose 4-epimerase